MIIGEISHKQNNDSLNKRYLYKLSSNILILLLSLVTAGMIPRGLGPAAYGDFSFLSNFFVKIVGFFDAGTSVAFYIKLSQRQKEYGIIKFYWIFVFVVVVVSLFFVLFTTSMGYTETLWPGQRVKFIWMALFFALFVWLGKIFSKMVDAYALTSKGEIIKVLQKVLATGLILLIYFSDWFSLTVFFIYNYIILIAILIALGRILVLNNIPVFPKKALRKSQFYDYVKEFYKYSAPLFFIGFFSLIVGVFDRWLLQHFAGSVQQGYFGLSSTLSRLSFVFTGAMTTLIMRDLTIAFKKGRIDQMQNMFNKYIPLLYVITVFFSLFIFFQAKKVTLILGGRMYLNATIPVSIMALYPIHQTYGQLNGAVFLAMEKTKLLRNLNIIFSLVQLPLLYFLIAPSSNYGLNMGATGLAIKMVVIQVAIVNVQLWFNCKYLQLHFIKLFVGQFSTILFLGLAAFIAASIGNNLFKNIIISFLVSGIIYTILTGVILFLYPAALLLNKDEIKQQSKNIKLKLFQLFKKS